MYSYKEVAMYFCDSAGILLSVSSCFSQILKTFSIIVSSYSSLSSFCYPFLLKYCYTDDIMPWAVYAWLKVSKLFFL